jgi:ribonuclease HII
VGTTQYDKSIVRPLRNASFYRVGVDENGLGARLGPLVVTAVVAAVSEKGDKRLNHWNSKKHRHVLDDSKQLIRHGDVRLGEAWARVLAHEPTQDPTELLQLISAVPIDKLKARCPKNAQLQCWNSQSDDFLASRGLVEQVRDELQTLRELGISPCRVVSRLVCTDELNARGQAGENRFLVDLHCMEELVAQIANFVTQPLLAVCGKVGGMCNYPRHFSELGKCDPETICETTELSAYKLARIGELRFMKDADSIDPLVMLASLVGKYLRELFVSRIGQHFSELVNDIHKPSGYHDSVTEKFAMATESYRKQSVFPILCFERTTRSDR